MSVGAVSPSLCRNRYILHRGKMMAISSKCSRSRMQLHPCLRDSAIVEQSIRAACIRDSRSQGETATSASEEKKDLFFLGDVCPLPEFHNRRQPLFRPRKGGRVPHVGPATVEERQPHVSPFAGRSVLTKRRPLLERSRYTGKSGAHALF